MNYGTLDRNKKILNEYLYTSRVSLAIPSSRMKQDLRKRHLETGSENKHTRTQVNLNLVLLPDSESREYRQ